MSVKPILFSSEMVRAILDGRKTVTRRVVKFLKKRNPKWSGYIPEGAILYGSNNIPAAKSPYLPGDVLWVRETWCKFIADHVIDGVKYAYRADTSAESERFRKELGYKWHPSIHMPKEAARIWLRVTDVRVERLQEIDEDGAIAEGLYKGWRLTQSSSLAETARQAFMWLWLHLARKAPDEMKWSANPWVWVIQFERCEKPEEV